MYYLLATYWMWFVVALLAGGAIGYWSSWRWASETRRRPWWAVIAFVVGLVIAVLHGLPGRAGLYLETLLLLSFWYAVGGLLGIWLGKAKSQDALVTANAAEDGRNAAAAKAVEDARLPAAAKTAEDARLAAAAEAAEDARNAAAAKAAEDARLAAAAKTAEDARLAAAAKGVEDARNAAAAKAAEEARLAAAAKAAEDARNTAAAKVAEAVSLTTTAATVAPSPATSSHPGTRPQGIAAPEGGHADDLKLIKGIGPKNEKISNALGIYHFRQIANWTPEEAIWVGHHIAFPGRIEREHWIPQARLLASGGDTDHSAGVKSGTILVDDSADAPLDAAAADALAKRPAAAGWRSRRRGPTCGPAALRPGVTARRPAGRPQADSRYRSAKRGAPARAGNLAFHADPGVERGKRQMGRQLPGVCRPHRPRKMGRPGARIGRRP
jgi:predicted flap endonuclease-1-like 5' DNA nuclease